MSDRRWEETLKSKGGRRIVEEGRRKGKENLEEGEEEEQRDN